MKIVCMYNGVCPVDFKPGRAVVIISLVRRESDLMNRWHAQVEHRL